MQKRWRILALTACVAVTVLGAASCSKSGKSAYEIACENGFTGTQSEWLSSLKGANGKDGESANAYQTYQALLQTGS